MHHPRHQTTLAEEQEALLALLLSEAGQAVIPADPITPREKTGATLLSFAQQRLWFLHQLDPISPAYNILNAVRLTGQLNMVALQQSLCAIVGRHEVLRTIFPMVEGKALAVTLPVAPVALPVVNLRGLSPRERDRQAEQCIASEAHRPFDLSHGPLMRCCLLWLEPQTYVLLLTMHHIVSDAWSRSVLIREVAALYTAGAAGAPSPLPELALQYADFAHWQRQRLRGAVLDTQLAYWQQQLDRLPVLALPTDHPRPSRQTSPGARQSFGVPQTLTAALRTLSQQAGATLFMTLLAAFQTLLYRYTGQDDMVIGTPVAHRTRLETEGLIGFFVNTLVLRTSLAGNPSFRELLQRVRQVTLAAHTYQEVPFELLVDALQPARDPGHTPLFQVLFMLHNVPQAALTFPGLTLHPLSVDTGTAKFELTLIMTESAGELSGVLEYRADLFEAATITRLAGHFITLLAGIVADAEQRLATLPLLTAVERQQLLGAYGTRVCPSEPCLHTWFEAQAAWAPEAIAVVCDHQQITYQALNRRANQLAHTLRALGVSAEVPVGLYMERSLELVVGILGILKAGGAYVPLDPTYPSERLAFILQDAQVAVLLTQAHLLAGFAAPHGQVVCLDADGDMLALQCDSNLPETASADNLAYMLYTSGSTGKPKGVLVSHRHVVRLFSATQPWFHVEAGDVWTLFHSYAFDFSVWELWGALLYGGKLVIVPVAVSRSPEVFYALLKQEQVTVLNQTPAAFRQLIRTQEAAPAPATLALRLVIFGGEALEPQSLQPWLQRHGDQHPRLVNMYGITETTVHVTYRPLTRADVQQAQSSPIGIALPDLQVYVLDAHRQPVPVGIPGELYVGGAGVARGYLKQPALTAERFIPHAFSAVPGARLYKSGDLVRWLPEGGLVYLGRHDQQVKIRGFRIELGEIEAVLGQHPAVQETVVLTREETPGNKRLVAYVVSGRQPGPTHGELRDFLRPKLPDYMIPAAFVMLATLPLTANGKVDRQALPAPASARPALATTFVAPRTPIEARLSDIWTRVLCVAHVGVHDNFFELGGDSILSLQIIARANQLGLRLSPRDIFHYQTIAELAAVVDLAPALHTPQEPVTGPVPLTPIQHWFFARHPIDVHHFNQAVMLAIQPSVSPGLLEQAVQYVLGYHDALRLRYRLTATGWQQIIVAPGVTVPYEHIDVSALAPGDHRRVIEAVATRLQASLHLEAGPLVRVAYFTLGAHQPGRLLLIIHHLAVDGVSWRILLTDLHQACAHLRYGEAIQLAPQTTSIKAWAEWLHTYAQSAALRQVLDYWGMVPPTPVCRLPVDYTGRANTVGSARVVTVTLSPRETHALLQEIPHAYHTRINDVLLTALLQAFACWTGTRALLLDLEGHGREDLCDAIDLSRTVGWFTSLFPLWLELGTVTTPGEALLVIKDQLRRLPQHGIGYGVLRYLSQEEEITRRLCALPQAEVCFNYLGQLDRVLPALSLFTLAPESSGAHRSQRGLRQYLLEINASVNREQLHVHWTYSEHVHRRDTIAGVAQAFLEALRTLITHCQSPTAGGYTHADFPLAQLGRQQLEQAFDEIIFAEEEA